MDQIELNYLKTVIAILNGSEQPVKEFEYGLLKLKFHKATDEEEVEKVVDGFTPKPLPTKEHDNTPAGMYRRLTGGDSVPDFMPPPPNKNGG